jgi:hypothetical protein
VPCHARGRLTVAPAPGTGWQRTGVASSAWGDAIDVPLAARESLALTAR